jgi:hypothetical protein
MPSANDLTTLLVVQEWLSAEGTAPGNSDSVLGRLITTCSASILNELQRSSLLSQTFVERIDGRGPGQQLIFLQNWPVTAVASVVINQRVVPPSVNGSYGWVLDEWDGYPPGDPQAVHIIGGGCFERGNANVVITYTAGYLVSAEPQTIPALSPWTLSVTAPNGPWAQDQSVVYASSGIALTKVPSAPAAGQYALGASPGDYVFAAADAGTAVLIAYSYVPFSLADSCMNWVAERYRYRQRIGMRSQAIGGQATTSYDVSDIPAYIKKQLNPFRKVLPV